MGLLDLMVVALMACRPDGGGASALDQANYLEVEIRSRITITAQRKLALFTL